MIVYTYGVFDLFHYGHIIALKKAKRLGDKLIIGVFTDEVAKGFKREPIIKQEDRFRLIEELELGEVVYQDEFSPKKNIEKYSVDIVTKGAGAGWEEGNVPEFDGVKSLLLDYTEGISTSDIIKKINDNL